MSRPGEVLPPRPAKDEPPSFEQFKLYFYDTAMGTPDWMAYERRGYKEQRLKWLEARNKALEDALRWVKAWFAKLEDNTDPLDHVLKEIRQRVHAPIHAVIDAALEGRER